MKIDRPIVALSLLALPALAVAAELPINPGLWETTMTRTNPMTGEPITETNQECVTDTSYNPKRMLQETEGCELINDDLQGDTLNFSMQCNIQGSSALVDGRFQTDGQTGSGDMDMKINAGGMDMTMNMNWTSVRLGDC